MKRIFGRRPVEEFFRSKPDPSVIKKIYVSPSLPKKYLEILTPLLKGARQLVEEKSRGELDRICEGNHQGIIVEITDRGTMPVTTGIPRPDVHRPLKDALEEFPGLYVVTDRIQDQQNLGSLIRSAEALGATALVVSGKGARPGEVSDRVSAGGSQHLPVFTIANPDGFLRDAARREYWILAAAGLPGPREGFSESRRARGPAGEDAGRFDDSWEAHAIEIELENEMDEVETDDDEGFGRPLSTRFVEAECAGGHGHRPTPDATILTTNDLDRLPKNGRYVLLIGHEGEGLKPSLLAKADFILSIPMHGRLNSLNAAVAGAILIERLLSVRPPERYD